MFCLILHINMQHCAVVLQSPTLCISSGLCAYLCMIWHRRVRAIVTCLAIQMYTDCEAREDPALPHLQIWLLLMQGDEGTFTFLESVLKEVLGLFPSQHIHIGGDEVGNSLSPLHQQQVLPSAYQDNCHFILCERLLHLLHCLLEQHHCMPCFKGALAVHHMDVPLALSTHLSRS